MKKGVLRLTLVCILVGGGTSASSEAKPPAWLLQLPHRALREYPPGTEAVTLLDEAHTVVTSKGEIRTRYRVARKILSPEGRDRALIRLGFDSETKVSKLSAWNLKPDGIVHEVSQKEAVETQLAAGILFQDNKVLLLQIPQADVGSLIAYEYEQRRRPYRLSFPRTGTFDTE